MSIIQLKNVSKFYYSKGVIASGFSKVNLKFDMGEFVAITGESGSGKSTLLNVISGLDSYEEGEMYINGEETSHYTEKDFEDYRRKYVGNIFQNFNLVNSYTVYQNIELVLLLNGNKKRKIKNKVIELIKKVDLYKFRNTKVSKLSGGQKQRVAIARALAKDTPIILADEPTRNLDSKSSKEVIKLLSEISKDKLVIIVTHNFEQIEPFVTRKIKMHDGHILEDKKIKEIKTSKTYEDTVFEDITLLNRFRLALRNTFNILPKFLLLLLVYLFITVAIISEYASFKEQEYILSKSGSNYIFNNSDDKRIVINKEDKTPFSDDEYEEIKKIDNVDYIVKKDLLLDYPVNFTDDNSLWLGGSANDISNFSGDLDIGRMPTKSNEIIIESSKNNYYIGYDIKDVLDKTLYIENFFNGEIDKNTTVKVVGVKYKDDNSYNVVIYMSDELLNKFSFQVNQSYSDIKVLFLNKYKTSNYYSDVRVKYNANVPKGEAYITNDLSYECPKSSCINQSLKIEVDSVYYNDYVDLKVTKTYTKNNMNKLLGISDFDFNNGTIYISVDDYNSLFNKENYQSSVFVKDSRKMDNVVNELESKGYKALAIKDTLVTFGESQIIKILRSIVTIILVVVLFFVSYFVIKVILKSRNKYYSTIRMLGATKKVSKQLLVIELLTVANLAYFSFVVLICLNSMSITNIGFISTINTYLNIKDYIILYIIITLMSYLISQKFSRKLFKKSAITTLGEEI